MGLLDYGNMDQGILGLAQGLLSAGAPSRTPVGFGQAMGIGMQGMKQARDEEAQRKAQEMQMAAHQQQFDMNDMQIEQAKKTMQANEAAKANLQQYVQSLPDTDPRKAQIEQAMKFGVPMSDLWKHLNPDAKFESTFDAQGREVKGWVTPNGFTQVGGAKQNIPEGMQVGANGQLEFIPSYIKGKKEIAAAGKAQTNIFNNTKDDFKNERDLRNDFSGLPTTKAFNEVQSAYDQINTALKAGTPAGDLAAATKLMKILDPGSVVRESELGMAMSATGMMDRVQNYAQMIASGEKLTPKQRQEFGALAQQLYSAASGRYNQSAEEYRGVAKDYNLNPDRIAKPVQSANENAGGEQKKVTLADIQATAAAAGKTTAEVTKAFRDKGFVIVGGK